MMLLYYKLFKHVDNKYNTMETKEMDVSEYFSVHEGLRKGFMSPFLINVYMSGIATFKCCILL